MQKMKILTCAAWIALACAAAAQTNFAINLTGSQLNDRLALVTNVNDRVSLIETEIPASVGFTRATISTNFADTAWANINLSAVTGQNPAVVILHVQNNTATARDIKLRTAADTATYGNADGIGAATVDASGMAYLAAVTDSSGVIQGQVSAGNFTLTLIAYIRRAVIP
jgi:hypothetical protein